MSQYFDERPAVPNEPYPTTVVVAGHTLALTTDRGVFSRGELDTGTAVLLKKAPAPPSRGRLLDLGCGYGPIAIALAAQSPDAEVWAVDVNERALALTAKNAAANDFPQIITALPDDIPHDLMFDAIYSNPPIRIGKDALHDLLSRWLTRLTPAGSAYLVVQRHLGGDSLAAWLQHVGYPTTRIASSKGYRVLHVGARPPGVGL
ncbi:MAG TPA: methyltransferase [Acidimicrobiia bacterium]